MSQSAAPTQREKMIDESTRHAIGILHGAPDDMALMFWLAVPEHFDKTCAMIRAHFKFISMMRWGMRIPNDFGASP